MPLVDASKARDPDFGLSLYLHLNIMYESREGFGESVHMTRLSLHCSLDAIRTSISCTGQSIIVDANSHRVSLKSVLSTIKRMI